MSFLPAHRSVGDGPNVALVIHGILGSGNNWRGFCRRLSQQLPDWRFITVDLRNHGDSRGAPPPHTLDACAEDLTRLCSHLAVSPRVVVGHSFGGKVALSLAQSPPQTLEQVWVLDASPESWSETQIATNEVSRVMAALRDIEVPLAERSTVVERLSAQGFSDTLARWMTTNLRRGDAGLVWRFNLNAAHEMLLDYFEQDLWSALEFPRASPEIHVVHAGQSSRWTPDVLTRIRSTPAGAPTHLHTIEDSGHWVHVDAPDVLVSLFDEWWPT